MQSHDDGDAKRAATEIMRTLYGTPEKPRTLDEKAVALADAGLNRITAGDLGEQVLLERQVGRVLVRQMPDDEHGILRVSAGGLEDKGYYLVFRGDRNAIRTALRHALRAIDRLERGSDA